MKQASPIPDKITEFNPFDGPEIVKVIHTTQAQEELWMACRLGGEDANRAYNESVSLLLSGKLNIKALEQALDALMRRHESLRAVFSTDGRYMIILKEQPFTLLFQDISKLQPIEKEKAITDYLRQDADYIFDLAQGPLLRVGLSKISAQEYRLVITAHHIIFDGWSLGILLQELGALYSAEIDNSTPKLPETESFTAFADHQLEIIQGEAYEKIERYWLKQFAKSVPELGFPTDYKRPSLRTYQCNRLDFPLDRELLAKLKQTGLMAGCSFVNTLLAAFEVFIYSQTGQRDQVIGLPTAGQSSSGMLRLIGHCANLLPLRSSITTKATFDEYLKQRKSELFDAYEHQPFSFGHLLKKLAIARDPSRVPLVPVVFNIDMGMTDGVSFAGLDYELLNNPRKYEIFEIFLNATGEEDNLMLQWSYNTTLFKASTIERMMNDFQSVLYKLVEAPNNALSEIAQRDLDLYESLNDTAKKYPKQPLHILLSERAKTTPNRIALKFKGKETTYADLQVQANQFAHYLIEHGVRSGHRIGVCLPRTAELIVALIGILKCGAAYIPLDPEYPKARLDFMLGDSDARFLVTTHRLSKLFSDTTELILLKDARYAMPLLPETAPETTNDQDELAYILYTSGTTGKPKGVPVTHKSFVNMLWSICEEPGVVENDTLLAITTISFDIAGVELFSPLLKGATVVLADTETARDGRLLLKELRREHINILQATPATWQMLVDIDEELPLKLKAFCGGEALSESLARKLLGKCDSLWNMYGPTETTVYSILKQIKSDKAPISIGRPIANTQVYIISEAGALAPPNTIGEIAIGGIGVAKGYWKRRNFTKEKFVKNTFSKSHNGPLYRTGDLGKLLPSGEIQCLGRLDQQIKIRGHRIEPEDIEQNLLDLEGIQAAVVIGHGDRLIAHVVPDEKFKTSDEQSSKWRKDLSTRLPSYLVPQELRVVKALPITPSGKIDRQALIQSSMKSKIIVNGHTLARTTTEKLVADIWKESLNLDSIDVFSDFFELGGHSILAVRVMTRIEKETGRRLPITTLFEYSTVEKFAALIDIKNDTIGGDSLVVIKPSGTKTPLYLIHGVGLNVRKFQDLVAKLDDEQPVFGLQGTGFDGSEEKSVTVEKIAARYIETIIHANPEGPYALAGHSYGGIIAFEMTRQLLAKGKKVSMLAMLDSYVEPHFYYHSALGKRFGALEYFVKKKISVIREMGRSWKDFRFHLNRTTNNFLDRNLRTKKNESEQAKIEYEHFLKVEEMNEKIIRRYHLVPQNFEIDLFRAQENMFFMHEPVHLGWKGIALKGINVHEVPGTHLNMFAPPNDEASATILQRVLNRRNQQKA